MTPRRPLNRRPWARAARAVAAVVLVRLAVGLVGPYLTALVVAPVLVVAGVRWWARVVEPRLFAPRRPNHAQVVAHTAYRPPAAGVDHVLFARALATVADRYRIECEHHADHGSAR